MARILVLNGANLNLLGSREPGIYGSTTLADIDANLVQAASGLGHELECVQSNSESELVDRIHAAANNTDFLLLNPGAFTHTSVALRDAILAVDIPFIEIHLSNVYAREEFRHRSYFSDIATGLIIGLGPFGYELALQAADHQLKKPRSA